QVIQLGPADLTTPDYVDPIQDAGVKRKYTLDSYAKARLPDRDGLANSGVLSSDYDALKNLDSFLVALFYLYMDSNGITGLKLGDIIAELPSLDVFNYWIHVYHLCINLGPGPVHRSRRFPVTRHHPESLLQKGRDGV